MLELYLDHLKKYGKNADTIKNHKSQLSQFLRWIDMDPALISKEDILKYLDHIKIYKTPSSINTVIAIIERFYLWMKDDGYILSNPAVGIKRTKVKFIPNWLTKSQKVNLLQVVEESGNKRNICLVHLMMKMGLKTVELCNLKYQDVILGEHEKGILVIKGSRQLIIPKETQKVLGEYIYERPTGKWLFSTQESEQLTFRSIQIALNTLKKRARIPKLNATMLRHTYGFELAEKKVPINIVAQQLGYERVEAALRYFRSM